MPQSLFLLLRLLSSQSRVLATSPSVGPHRSRPRRPQPHKSKSCPRRPQPSLPSTSRVEAVVHRARASLHLQLFPSSAALVCSWKLASPPSTFRIKAFLCRKATDPLIWILTGI